MQRWFGFSVFCCRFYQHRPRFKRYFDTGQMAILLAQNMANVIISLTYTLLFATFAFIVPAYQCCKASTLGDLSELWRWCCYWVVLATFLTLQYAIDIMLSWIPFYYLLKLVFLVYLWHPKWRLAQPIYQKAISPVLISLQPDIDKMIADSIVEANEIYNRLVQSIVAMLQHAIDVAATFINQGHHQGAAVQQRAYTHRPVEDHEKPDLEVLRHMIAQNMQQQQTTPAAPKAEYFTPTDQTRRAV